MNFLKNNKNLDTPSQMKISNNSLGQNNMIRYAVYGVLIVGSFVVLGWVFRILFSFIPFIILGGAGFLAYKFFKK